MANVYRQRRTTPPLEETPTRRAFLLGVIALLMAVSAVVTLATLGGTAQAQESTGATASASASASASPASGSAAATISAASSVPPSASATASATTSATALASSGGPSFAPTLALVALVALVASGVVATALLRRGAS